MPKATPPKELQPATALWRLYRPASARYAFKASTPAEARRWQRVVRPALVRQLGLPSIPKVAARARLLETVDRGDHVRQKWMLRTGLDTLMPFYLLLPKAAPAPLPVMLAFHGHGYGVKDIVGLWEDGRERSVADGYHRDFAVALCRSGFAVAAPEISCFGERQTDFSSVNTLIGQGVPGTCAHTSALALHLGLSTVGLRVHDGLRLVDYLETRKDLDTTRLGAMGISGGGMHTLFSTCVDERIRACVISGYFCTFKDSILAVAHCVCNFVPGLGQFGEMSDLAGLIAPRPLLVEAGTYDPIFPMKAVRAAVVKTNAVYRVFGAGAVQADYFEGRHRISGCKAYAFLKRELGAGRDFDTGRG